MSYALPKPKSMTADEVVLRRSDWEQIVSAFEMAEIDEDADDIAAVAAARADEAEFARRLETQRGGPVETTIPIEVVKAEIDGAHPVRAWRGYRGWSVSDLADKSGAGLDLIDDIETRKTIGGIETLARLARALGVPMELLTEDDE